MADNNITIERSLDQIKQGIADIGAESRNIEKDLRAVNAGLKFDPNNTELLAQKQELLSQKLKNSKDRSQELTAAIAELNRLKSENGQLTDGQSKLLTTYEQQLKDTQIQITALTGATQKQAEAQKKAEDSTKSFSASMTEFQSNMRAVNQVMGGVLDTYKLLGGDPDSATGKFLQQTQSGIKIMTQFAGVGKLLKNQNILTAGSFSNLALAAGAALGAFTLVGGIIGKLNPDMQKTVGIATAVAGGIGAIAIAALAMKGVLTWGVGIPVMLAAVGAGIAGLKAALGSATPSDENVNIPSSTPSIPTPSIPTPSIPSRQTITQVAPETQVATSFNYGEFENSVYRALVSFHLNFPNDKSITVVINEDAIMNANINARRKRGLPA